MIPSRSPAAAERRICPEGPITPATAAGGCNESRIPSAPDCSTVVVVPSRNGRASLVPATRAAQVRAIGPRPRWRRPHRSDPMRRMAFVTILLCSPLAAAAQAPALTVESIMRGPDLVGTAPFNVQFSADGRYAHFRWRQPGVDTLDQDYRVTVAAPQRLERLPRNAVDTIPLANGAWSPDHRRQIVVLKGDLWLIEQNGLGARRRLTPPPGAESPPAWPADGPTVHFTRPNNPWA